jgi:hypothetical protein
VKYEACEKVYCYQVSYNPFVIPKRSGEGGAIGALIVALYYYNDGNGSFERLTSGFIAEETSWTCNGL